MNQDSSCTDGNPFDTPSPNGEKMISGEHRAFGGESQGGKVAKRFTQVASQLAPHVWNWLKELSVTVACQSQGSAGVDTVGLIERGANAGSPPVA